jgi:hypothetical protein
VIWGRSGCARFGRLPPCGWAPSAFASASPSAFASAAGFASACGAAAAVAPFANAFAASPSSTEEDAVVTSIPACFRAARASFEVIPRSFAISWTRFFAMR